MPSTPERRREQIKLHIELSNALIHTKGHASPETKASFEKARLLIANAEKQGESLDDPLLLFSVLYGFWVANRMAFKGETACELAQQFLDLAGDQRAAAPRMIGHMWHGRGRSLDASNLLAPVLARFTEGFHTPDLVEANALLKSLPRSQYS